MTEKMIESHMRHLWYITEELVIFSLWDDEVPARERRAVADKLLQTDPPDEWRTGKPDMPQVLPDKPRLQDLVGSRSHLFFHNLRVGTNWLRRPVRVWRTDPEYVRIKTYLKDLKVVNDIAEQCIKDITEYADMVKDSVHRDEVLLNVMEHRGQFKDITRQGLANATLIWQIE